MHNSIECTFDIWILFRCWVNLANPIAYGTIVPVAVAAGITLIITEASGQAIRKFKPLPNVDKNQIAAAQ